MIHWQLFYIRSLAEELKEPKKPWILALPSCGRAFSDNLQSNVENIIAGVSIESSCRELEQIIDVSYSNVVPSLTGPKLIGWMRLYTDASILRCLVNIKSSTALETITTLDRIIIFCGPASGRLEFIVSIIENIQHYYLPIRPFIPQLSHYQQVPPIRNAKFLNTHHTILSLCQPPSLFAFQSTLSKQPFVVRGYARDWPAMKEHPWGSAAYLRSISGPGRIVPVEVGQDYRKHDWTQRLMSWDAFLATLELADQPIPPKSLDTIYLAQYNLLNQFPALRADIIVPDYVYSLIDPPEFAGYRPPGNDDQLIINVWLGPQDTISPAHTDPYYNLFVQIVGQKRIWLAPPSLTPSMYSFPSTAQDCNNPASNLSNPDITNTSRVDVFSDIDKQAFPNFSSEVVPNAIGLILEPSDILYLPPGWWHAMRSEETSFSVSMWF